jgi:hypothetical protein
MKIMKQAGMALEGDKAVATWRKSAHTISPSRSAEAHALWEAGILVPQDWSGGVIASPWARVLQTPRSRWLPKAEKVEATEVEKRATLQSYNDPVDSTGFTKAMSESMNDHPAMAADKEYGMWWSATDSGSIIDHAGGDDKGEDWDLSDHDCGEGGDSELDWSAFDRRF